MGQRGPAPTSSRLKLLKGETRPSRVNYEEPLPRRADFSPPKDISPQARGIWEEVIEAVAHTGMLTSADLHTLRLYCEAAIRYRQAEQMYLETGPLTRGQNGEVVKSPLHQIVRDNAVLMLQLASKLGLTPAARSGLRGELDGEANTAAAKLDALISSARRAR